MNTAPNIPIWLAQAISNFSEVERMYALNYALTQLDPQTLASVYAFALSKRPAFSREAQLLVDQIGYKVKTGANGAMNGYANYGPSMGGFHPNPTMSHVQGMAGRIGFGGLGSMGWGEDLEKSISSGIQQAVSIAQQIQKATGTPPPAGSQTNPTGYDDLYDPFAAMPGMVNNLPTPPATPTAPKPAAAVAPIVPPKKNSTGLVVGGVLAVLAVGGIAWYMQKNR